MFILAIHKSSCWKYIIMFFTLSLNISTSNQKQKEWIYVLQWTYGRWDSWETYWHLEKGREAFISRNCSFQNCFLTTNRTYFSNILDFDVLVFNVEHIIPTQNKPYDIPENRSEKQLYIFLSSEPAALYSITDFYNDFFNLTWTYKFASDIFHPFFVVKNNIGNVIAPKVNVKWTRYSDLAPTNSTIIQKLKNKRIAAAGVVSQAHCDDRFRRFPFIRKLRQELSKYGHRIDIYGTCAGLSCPHMPNDRAHLLTCYDKIESDYYFYLAFENSFSEDYVSEKVLHGLQHLSVPIVFGGADYTRFLPSGSYIDALILGEEKLAKEMNDIINDPPRYYDFFKWHGYYSFQDTTDSDHRESACTFCAFLNNQRLNNTTHTYHDMTGWWNGPPPGPTLNDNSAVSVPRESDKKQDLVSNFVSNVVSLVDFFLDE